MADTALIVRLDIGAKIEQYTVTKQLGEGTFGAVYKVKSDAGVEAALKTEHISMKLLQMEMHIMQKLRDINSQNCCLLLDKGRTDTFNYVIMKLVGASLQDMKKTGPDKHMSLGCALSSSIQCLSGLQELHTTGYVHRDVKPGNYAVGLEETGELRRIYLLDFGMCKPHRSSLEHQSNGKFRGTPRYAPLASHRLGEHCRRDDLESWFYQLIDFCNASLPWKVATDLGEIGRIKTECRRGSMLETLLKGCPAECARILEIIDSTTFAEQPNYELIKSIMREAINSHQYKEFPYDWEPANAATTPMTTSPTAPTPAATPTAKGRSDDEAPSRMVSLMSKPSTTGRPRARAPAKKSAPSRAKGKK